MNPLICADSMTWEHLMGERDRQAVYAEPVAVPCQWEPVSGETRSPNGDISEYRVEVITEQPGIMAGDRITKGETYEVIRVDEVRMRGHLHHYEVYAR